jgi:hypothetical protein
VTFQEFKEALVAHLKARGLPPFTLTMVLPEAWSGPKGYATIVSEDGGRTAGLQFTPEPPTITVSLRRGVPEFVPVELSQEGAASAVEEILRKIKPS